jgi:hypothetical protein
MPLIRRKTTTYGQQDFTRADPLSARTTFKAPAPRRHGGGRTLSHSPGTRRTEGSAGHAITGAPASTADNQGTGGTQPPRAHGQAVRDPDPRGARGGSVPRTVELPLQSPGDLLSPAITVSAAHLSTRKPDSPHEARTAPRTPRLDRTGRAGASAGSVRRMVELPLAMSGRNPVTCDNRRPRRGWEPRNRTVRIDVKHGTVRDDLEWSARAEPQPLSVLTGIELRRSRAKIAGQMRHGGRGQWDISLVR